MKEKEIWKPLFELLRNNSAFRIKLSEKRGGLSYKEIKSPS